MTPPLAVRRNVPLIVGIAGPSGGGKTLSALRIAKGMSGGAPFSFIDTERGRALEYADYFQFHHFELEEPFSPARYAEKIAEVEALNPPVIVLDSMSHEHAGDGGVLDMHEQELERMAGDDWKKREAVKFAAWIKPKKEHKRLIAGLLRMRCHLIVCLRAEEKIDLVKNEQGKLEVRPKRTMAGHVGWIPVCGKDLPYELTVSLVVTPDAPGVPHPIKLGKQLRPFVPLDAPLDEKVGVALSEWAAGAKVPGPEGVAPPEPAAAEGVSFPPDAEAEGARTPDAVAAGSPVPGMDVGQVAEESLFQVPATVARHEDRG